MQSLNDDERKEVLGEVLFDELKAIREYVQDVPDIKQDIAAMKQDMDVMKADIQELKFDVHILKADMKVVKAVVTDHSRQFKQTDKRLTNLESAA
jgi:chromosome segregation ATPase